MVLVMCVCGRAGVFVIERAMPWVHERFSTEKSDWHIQSNRQFSTTECASRIAQSKKSESKKLFSDCL